MYINLSIAIYMHMYLLYIRTHEDSTIHARKQSYYVNMDPVGLGCLPVNENQQNKIP